MRIVYIKSVSNLPSSDIGHPGTCPALKPNPIFASTLSALSFVSKLLRRLSCLYVRRVVIDSMTSFVAGFLGVGALET